jgi:uncharacterized protein YbbK (DUF523 family)
VHRVLVSACLLGARVRYHGGDALCEHPTLRRWQDEGRLVTACPEVDGGLGTPRPPAEIVGPDRGRGVIAGLAVVRTAAGVDVTQQFLAGASRALAEARRHGVRAAILKDGSPSCGSSFAYDGTFSGLRVPGRGVTAALLEANGIRVFSESRIDEADSWLRRAEAEGPAQP